MKQTLKRRFLKTVGILIVGFILLFIFRIIYGYTLPINQRTSQTQFFESISSSKRNYASKKYKSSAAIPSQAAVKVDQKYEKVAEVSTTSKEFEAEEKIARKEVKKYNALIQFEQKSGNTGSRRLNLLIGVPPENFDSLYNNLIEIGKIKAKRITKKDKTNEYKELNAKKVSLEKIRNSLIDLKSKGGKIDEYMQLENRILEIEQQLQELGVSLGDFDDENEFCTVQFSLLEGKEVTISLMHRVKVALQWTIEYYSLLMVALFFMTLFAYLLLLSIDKLKLIERLINKK